MKIWIVLENKKSYSHFWNFFSKSLIIKENSELNPLILVERKEYIALYKKIFDFLWKKIIEVHYEDDLVNLLYNKKGIFFMETSKLENINTYSLEKKNLLHIEKDKELNVSELLEKLANFWYTYSEYASNGSYKKIGDILSITRFDGSFQYQISLWGDTVENIYGIERKLENGEIIPLKKEEIHEVYLWRKSEIAFEWNDRIIDIIDEKWIFTILDSLEFDRNYEELLRLSNVCSFDIVWTNLFEKINLHIDDVNIENIDTLKKALQEKESYIFTKNEKLIQNFTEYNNIESSHIREVNAGFLKSFSSPWFICICDDVILKTFIKKRVKKSISSDLDLLLKIKNGDFIVHIDHGIWIFNGIVTKDLWGYIKEYIEILYKDDDKLYVPTTEVERISKYVWVDNPRLTWLWTKEWWKHIEKAEKDIERIAEELLEVYASRKLLNWFPFVYFKEKQQEFQRAFPYIYTHDQMTAIDDIIKDMSLTKNMDRLLVGDVWFWKTEIAFNAIYNAFLNKKQSIFISPLVVLAYEHYEKALDRLWHFWVKVWVLTRLESAKNVSLTMQKLASGEIDVIIGTHKLLSEKIVYKNLWLIVVDEEHKFWVEDKEKIKKIKTNIDALSMSATPIPRSLNMALSWVRDMSILREPPMWRKDISTTVSIFDEWVIYNAGIKEFERWWQIFFIHNRVENIETIKNTLAKIFPDKKIVVTHGKLPGDELEDRILDFKHKKFDILLSTTVIENGIDFSNVNTIFINECQSFWLSQIHQLRGRVWRSDKQWYCFLLYKKELLGEDTVKRLKTIVKYSYLGAGFELAIKDLEIRWGWDILGVRQSGQATEIGIHLFIEMLENKIEELKSDGIPLEKRNKEDISIDLWISAFIHDDYFNGETDKINFYREIENIRTLDELEDLKKEFYTISWNTPEETKNLFDMLTLKIKCQEYKIISIKRVGINYEINFSHTITVEELKNFLKLDKDVIFHIVSLDKIRTPKKKFSSDGEFLHYLLTMFHIKLDFGPKKVKLKRT